MTDETMSTSITVTLTPALRQFVDDQATRRGFADPAAYIAWLIASAQRATEAAWLSARLASPDSRPPAMTGDDCGIIFEQNQPEKRPRPMTRDDAQACVGAFRSDAP